MDTIPVLTSIKYMPYFIQKAVIKGVQPLYHNEVFGITWDVDLALLLEVFKKDGTSYEYQLNIRCNFKKNSDTIIGWGSAFKIQKIFQSLNIQGVVNSDGTIPQNCLDQLINREIFVLSYISGKRDDERNRYQVWDLLSNSREAIDSEFQFSVIKGYPKNYQPELLKENKLESNPDLPF